MSTKTTNYEFIKPELTDSADITATNGNWDKIDTELKKKYDADNKPTAEDIGARPNTWMPTASDVGAVGWEKSYHVTDVVTWASSQNNPTSGYATPETLNIPMSGYFLLELSVGAENAWKVVTATTISGTVDSGTTFVGIYANGGWRGWTQFSDSSKYLPLSGGTLSGHLNTKGITFSDHGLLSADNNHIAFRAMLQDNATQNEDSIIQLLTSNMQPDTAKKIRFSDTNSKWYLLYGEHNVTCGTSTPSSLANGCIYQQY